MTKILGVSPAHDSSICLMHDGEIKFFLKEERFSRKKRDFCPIKSLSMILQNEKELDFFVFTPPTRGSFGQHIEDWSFYINKFSNVKNIIDVSDDHHLQHASLAFYNSGFSEAAVLVVDGGGSTIGETQELESIFYASYPDNFTPVYKNYLKFQTIDRFIAPYNINEHPDCEITYNHIPGGIVNLYTTATILIGQNHLENGKTMGLAAYGHETDIPNFFIDKTNKIKSEYFIDAYEWSGGGGFLYKDYYFYKTRNLSKDNYKIHANYAYSIQKQTEEAMEFLIKKAVEKTNSKNICISGGYALNVVANSLFLKKFPGINFYFEPVADDSGNSIGSAYLQYRKITKDKTVVPLNHTFFHGFSYFVDKNIGIEFDEVSASHLLNDNKSLGLYYKLAEAGPRALGHRSILYDARNKDAKDIVNNIKKREWYRPFAAVCLEEDSHKYFYLYDNIGYEFMTINAEANELAKIEIPGVLHVDGTCRIQIVKNKEEPLFKLLTEFKKLTGVGVLLNTSFNLAGEALVETPEDAIKTLKNSELNCLWFPEIQRAIFNS